MINIDLCVCGVCSACGVYSGLLNCVWIVVLLATTLSVSFLVCNVDMYLSKCFVPGDGELSSYCSYVATVPMLLLLLLLLLFLCCYCSYVATVATVGSVASD